MMAMGVFQTDLVRFESFNYSNFEGFTNPALTLSIFELEKCSFFKRVKILQEIDWYHYQGASPALTCIIWHQTITNTPTRGSVTSEPNMCVWGEEGGGHWALDLR